MAELVGELYRVGMHNFTQEIDNWPVTGCTGQCSVCISTSCATFCVPSRYPVSMPTLLLRHYPQMTDLFLLRVLQPCDSRRRFDFMVPSPYLLIAAEMALLRMGPLSTLCALLGKEFPPSEDCILVGHGHGTFSFDRRWELPRQTEYIKNRGLRGVSFMVNPSIIKSL